ncbi:MAG: response regulator [Alphaproteobacteria bacterium]|nr:response regulator [Alphaproteobacteria bacterium]
MGEAEQQKIYAYIGQRVRERRKLLKLSQKSLAALMGFSYQQVQKYEMGASKVSAGKLLAFARILNVPVGYFYEGFRREEEIGARIAGGLIQKRPARAFHILLVEDNPSDVILFRKALAFHAARIGIHSIHDPGEVMGYLQNHEAKFGHPFPDLIVADLAMPKISGLDILRAVKRTAATAAIPVVILTNSVSAGDMAQSYRCGASGFIQKAVDFDAYRNTIETAVKYWSEVVALPCG